MQFSTIVLRVAEETGLDVTADATKLKAWVNGAYQQISGFFNWPWLLTNFVVQTVADITTYTASVAGGGTAVTLDTAHTPTLAGNYWIRFDDTSDDWYPISTHVAGTAAVVIGNAYVSSTALVAGACTIRKIFYDLPSTVDRVTGLRQAVTNREIPIIDANTFDKALPDPDNTGTPSLAYLNGMTTTGYWQLGFHPIPDEIINIQGRGYKPITELSGDSDAPYIPAKWHNVLVFLALALYGHDYIDDDRRNNAVERAREIIRDMVKECNPVPGMRHVIQPWDSRTPNNLGVRLPSNYPWPYGI